MTTKSRSTRLTTTSATPTTLLARLRPRTSSATNTRDIERTAAQISEPDPNLSVPPSAPLQAYYEFVTVFVQMYVWLKNKQYGEGAKYPTKSFYDSLYIFFLIYAGYFAVSATSAIWCPGLLNAVIIASLRFCEAGAFGIPTLVLLYYGRDKMFLTMARIIDQVREHHTPPTSHLFNHPCTDIPR